MSNERQYACTECGYELTIPVDTVKGEILQCSDCGVDLEVLSLESLEIGLAPEEEEDWGE